MRGRASELQSGGGRPPPHTKPKECLKNAKIAICQKLSSVVCIFTGARQYVDDFPYSIGNFGPFGGGRCGGRMRHHATVEGSAVPVYRGDCGVAGVLRRVIFPYIPTISLRPCAMSRSVSPSLGSLSLSTNSRTR